MARPLEPLPLPINILDGPQCYIQWPVWLLPHIAGMIEHLKYPTAWEGTELDKAMVAAVIEEQIARLVAYECAPDCDCDCDDCTSNNAVCCALKPDDELLWLAEIGKQAMFENYLTCEDFRDNNGTLEIRCCGVWTPIFTPGDTNADIIPPDIDTDETTVYPCGKAYALANFIVTLGDEIWDESDNVLPLFFINHIQNIMGADLKNAWLQQAQNDALIMKGVVVASSGLLIIQKSDVIISGLVDDLACKLLASMSDGPTDDKEAIYEAATSAFRTLFPPGSLPWGIYTSPYWDKVLRAIGPTLMMEIAQSGAYDDTALCDCEGGVVTPPIPYSGLVWFSNSRNIELESGGGILETVNRATIQKMEFTVAGGPNTNYQEVHWTEGLDASGVISELEIQLVNRLPSANPDYFPADTWSDTDPTPQSIYLEPPIEGVTAPDSTVYTKDENSVKAVFGER